VEEDAGGLGVVVVRREGEAPVGGFEEVCVGGFSHGDGLDGEGTGGGWRLLVELDDDHREATTQLGRQLDTDGVAVRGARGSTYIRDKSEESVTE